MSHIAPRLTLALCALAALAGCDGSSRAMDRGVAAYEAADYASAVDAFREAGGAAPSDRIRFNTALAALAADDLDAATEALDGAEGDSPDLDKLVTFLRGNVAYSLAVKTGQQADTVESEPFAYDLALSHAEDARDAWREASAQRPPWPEAERNVERADLLIQDLMARKAAAGDRKKRKEAGGPPKVRPRPLPTAATDEPPNDAPSDPTRPDDAPESGDGEAEAADTPSGASAVAELPREAVLRLIETLAEREREKRALRRAEREASGGGVERDW